ncbi:isocitrate lyase/PEP mutase family protein [Burkholderia sp. 3C]
MSAEPTPPQALRAQLAAAGLIAAPSVWDGLSARLSVEAGFRTLFLSGLCLAAARLGGPDLDLLTFSEMIDALRMVRDAVPTALVIADGDHGFGNAMNVERTVQAYGRAGAAAVMIEDKLSPRPLLAQGKPCVTRDEARIRVRAAVGAARESGMLVLARTDTRPSLGIDEALARIALFVEEGADILMLDSPADDAQVRLAVEAAQGRPLFCAMTGENARAPVSLQRARELGVKLATFPFATLTPVIEGMRQALQALAAGRIDGPVPFARAELFETLGYGRYEARARAMAQRQCPSDRT